MRRPRHERRRRRNSAARLTDEQKRHLGYQAIGSALGEMLYKNQELDIRPMGQSHLDDLKEDVTGNENHARILHQLLSGQKLIRCGTAADTTDIVLEFETYIVVVPPGTRFAVMDRDSAQLVQPSGAQLQ